MHSNIVDTFLQLHQMLLARIPAVPKFCPLLEYPPERSIQISVKIGFSKTKAAKYKHLHGVK